MLGGGLKRRAARGFNPVSGALGVLGFHGYLRFAGARIHAPDHVASWDTARLIAEGEYDIEGLAPSRGDRVIDIGANIGLFSLWAVHNGATTTAYEPGPDAYRCLQRNTRGKPIRPVHAAVVGTGGPTVELYLHDERSTRNTLLGQEIGTGAALDRSVAVPASPIAEVLSDGCDLLKLDCEGAEFDILRHADLSRVDRVVLEYHTAAGDPDELLALLGAGGLSPRVIHREPMFGVIGAARP